ncbi:MAG: ATP-binding cassette domain-containing protein [Holosporales bacterium]|nr:ATP-binding cassette domain-containing protein [Holosporales bacterium]
MKVLDGINLEISKGSITGIVGPSGGGKSTLLRCIQGLETIDSGKIEKNGRTGFMFQDFQLFPHMTVLDNLIFAPCIKNKSQREQHIQNAMQILQELGIEKKSHSYPNTLSGGQKQRVALARSLMMNPDILLCDEPTSGLDQSTSDEVASLLKSINNDTGVTILIASHDLDFLKQISQRIIPMTLVENNSCH